MSIEKLIDAVNAASNYEDVSSLAKEFGLQIEDRSGRLDQILSVHKGVVGGVSVTVTHRWYDRCKTFSIQPDGNKVELAVDGKIIAVGSFEDDR